jgi:hypothetical protein
MFRILILIFLIGSFVEGCKGKSTNEHLAIQFCQNSKIDYCDNTIVLIPSVGCGNCINAALDFLKKKSRDEKYQFVFVQIQDRKLVKSWLRNYKNQPNIHLDTAGLSRSYGFSREYPMLILTNHCEISEVIVVDVKNKSIWEKL